MQIEENKANVRTEGEVRIHPTKFLSLSILSISFTPLQ